MGKPIISNKGGIFNYGNSHLNGGIPIVVSDTMQNIEVEKGEPLIPKEALQSEKVKVREGTNLEILDEINKEVGAKGMSQPAKVVESGDVIICKRSAHDKKKRTYKGTNKQIAHEINTGGGCNPILNKGNKHKQGGNVAQLSDFQIIKNLSGEHKETYLFAHELSKCRIVDIPKCQKKILEYWNKNLKQHFEQEEQEYYNKRNDAESINFLKDHDRFRRLITQIEKAPKFYDIRRFSTLMQNHIIAEERYFAEDSHKPMLKDGGGVKSDINELNNEGLNKALLSFREDFNVHLANYLQVGKENYVISDKENTIVFFRDKSLGDFTSVEKIKIGEWINPYFDISKKPLIAEYLNGYAVDGNRIKVAIVENQMYKNGGFAGEIKYRWRYTYKGEIKSNTSKFMHYEEAISFINDNGKSFKEATLYDKSKNKLVAIYSDDKLNVFKDGGGVGGDAKDKVFVHETDAESFDNFDLNKVGSGQGDQWLGNGIYLQEKGSFKLEKYGKNKIETTLNPNAKIFNVENTPNGKYTDSFVEWAVKNTEAGKRKAQERIADGLSLDNLLPRDILKRNPEAVERLKEQGYDGLYLDGELVVYNPDVLQIKPTEQPFKEQHELENSLKMELGGITPHKEVRSDSAIIAQEFGNENFETLHLSFSENIDGLVKVPEITKEINGVDEPTGIYKTVESLVADGYMEYVERAGGTYKGFWISLYELTEKGKDIVNRMNIRFETRKGVQEGTDLFPEYANIPEFIQEEPINEQGELKKENYRPILWHLTMNEFCEYAEHYEVDTRLEGTKARLECKEFYRYVVILPLLHESAERNVFLLAVETNQLPYSKVVEIIKSANAWDENNKFIKQLIEYNQLNNYNSSIWKTPRDLYLSSDYFKNNFTKPQANKWYAKQIYKMAILDDRELHSFMEKGIVKFSDVQDRIREGDVNITTAEKRYIDKLKNIADKFKAKLKLKGLRLLLDDELVKAVEQPISIPEEQVKQTNRFDTRKPFLPPNQQRFSDELYFDTKAGVKHNKISVEKVARKHGIMEQNLAKELAEYTIATIAREYANETGLTEKQTYEKIVKLYESQVNLSHRTSESILFQQYSTPAPLGYLMGLYCGVGKDGNYFEPSAGNGLLTIASEAKNFVVNEIDEIRNRNLQVQGFKEVLKQDASEPFIGFEKKFDAVITNPPFGKTEVVKYGNSDIKSLEQVMALRALDTMKDNGRSAIIIGGHTEYDSEGRIQAGKNRTFFVYLYKHYNVEDVINISGRDLYSRQGTAFNTRIILINGRKETPSGFPPLIEKPIPMNETNSYTPVNSFDVLWERINKLL